MPKLNQILAIEKQTKTNAAEQLTGVYQLLQKEPLLSGIARSYKPLAEDGEKFPPESQQVQVRVPLMLKAIADCMSPLYDITAARDMANTSARADVVVNGAPVLRDIPAVTLLWLEKQLTDMHTVIIKLPELPATETWKYDANQDCYITEPVDTSKSKKIQKPLVLAPATEQHPAQVQLVTEDVLVGYWTTVKFSGALPRDEKRKLRDRVESLLAAVKFAREQANMTEAPKVSIAKEVFSFLFA